jgi:small subunit ribosomal protein S18
LDDEYDEMDLDDISGDEDSRMQDSRSYRQGGRSGGHPYRGGGSRRYSRRRRSFHRDLLSQITKIDYKDYETLRNFMTDRGKIRPRRQTGISAKQQRAIAQAIKRARHMALLPFHSEHLRDS